MVGGHEHRGRLDRRRSGRAASRRLSSARSTGAAHPSAMSISASLNDSSSSSPARTAVRSIPLIMFANLRVNRTLAPTVPPGSAGTPRCIPERQLRIRDVRIDDGFIAVTSLAAKRANEVPARSRGRSRRTKGSCRQRITSSSISHPVRASERRSSVGGEAPIRARDRRFRLRGG